MSLNKSRAFFFVKIRLYSSTYSPSKVIQWFQCFSKKLMPFLWNNLSLVSKYASVYDITSSLEPNLFLWSIFLRFQTPNCCWGSDLENRIGAEAIRSAIHVVLGLGALSWWKSTFSSSFVAVFCRFLPSNAPIMQYNIRYRWFFLLKVIDEQNTLRIPKQGGQNLPCWCLRVWSLWTAFYCFCQLSWLPTWFQSEVMDLGFIHSHISKQKPVLKQLQTSLWIVDVLLFLIDWEQTQHLL